MVSTAVFLALFFTVVLLVTTGYFLMGGLPLLILKHDVPLDARFIRSFFHVYYRAAFWASLGAGAGYGLWGRPAFAFGALANAAAVTLLRRHMLRAMEHLGAQIAAQDARAIAEFRRLHASALLVNLLQVVLIVWAILQLSQQFR